MESGQWIGLNHGALNGKDSDEERRRDAESEALIRKITEEDPADELAQ
jgi:hypothetical protein